MFNCRKGGGAQDARGYTVFGSRLEGFADSERLVRENLAGNACTKVARTMRLQKERLSLITHLESDIRQSMSQEETKKSVCRC